MEMTNKQNHILTQVFQKIAWKTRHDRNEQGKVPSSKDKKQIRHASKCKHRYQRFFDIGNNSSRLVVRLQNKSRIMQEKRTFHGAKFKVTKSFKALMQAPGQVDLKRYAN